MEIKLKIIKPLLSVGVFLLISLASFAQEKENEKEWIQCYKDLVYYDGLLKGLNN